MRHILFAQAESLHARLLERGPVGDSRER